MVLTACLGDATQQKEKIHQAIGVSKAAFYKERLPSNTYEHRERKKIVRGKSKLMKQCIREFFHSDEASRIDTHTRRIVNVPSLEEDDYFGDGVIIEKHPGRTWEVSTIDEQYALFCESRNVDTYKQVYGNHFHLPSRSFYYQNRCPCVKPAKMQLCVDIIISGLTHYMLALNKYISNNKEVKRQLTFCSCSQHLLSENQQ